MLLCENGIVSRVDTIILGSDTKNSAVVNMVCHFSKFSCRCNPFDLRRFRCRCTDANRRYESNKCFVA